MPYEEEFELIKNVRSTLLEFFEEVLCEIRNEQNFPLTSGGMLEAELKLN